MAPEISGRHTAGDELMTDEATSGLRFRPSACRRFIVAQVGAARPHVLTLAEAEITAEIYRRAGREASDPAVQLYEHSTANLLELAIFEASGR